MGKLVLARPEHAHAIKPKEAEFGETLEDTRFMEDSEPCWALLHGDGRPQGITGVLPMKPGVGFLWAYVDEQANPRDVIRVCQLWEVWLDMQRLYHRVQAHVRAGWDEGIMVTQACGLHVESLMEAYGTDGSDYIMFAWVRH